MSLSKKQKLQRNQILESLYTRGPLSRAELSRLLGITPATMTEVTAYLIKEGVIKELGEAGLHTGSGRKKVLLEVAPNYSHYIGVELSEHKMTICLTDNLGTSVLEEGVSLRFDPTFPLTVNNVREAISTFLTSHAHFSIQAIGIAIPGHFEKDSQTIASNNPLWSQFDIALLLSSFSIPVFVKNNVKCMALTELYLSSKLEGHNFLFLNLRRGIFAAYVYEGKLYGDRNYLVGEVGHITVNPEGQQCECGKTGCLQTYASITWILKKSRIAYESGRAFYLQLLVDSASQLTINHVLSAYMMGDEIIHRIIEQAVDYLALQINNATMMLNLDAVYVHGKLFEESLIATQLQTKLEQSIRIVEQNHDIHYQVLEYDSFKGAMGACALAIKNHFINNYLD
ncbi:ROK family transcriptional regulator [Streptococcus jiangjianxini]|uniref:ROK family transcriptional regulator n=1 Tax=Streptococcus jiangjianxini TaxID=3161189 RepID=UPI0032EB7FC0